MTHLLDTNTCSAYLKGRSGLSHRFIQHGGGLAISTVVVGELCTWAWRRSQREQAFAALDNLLADVTVLDFDTACAYQFGEIRATLLISGRVIESVDLMIASVALVHDLTVVTHNVRDFQDIPGLRVVDWL